MLGLHLTADLRGCAVGACLTDPATLRAICLAAVDAAGLRAVGALFHGFEPTAAHRSGGGGGVTGMVLLAESHLAVHTWPELGAVTLDAYVCNLGHDNRGAAQALIASLIDAFGPATVERHALERGAAPLAPPRQCLR